MSYEDDIGFAPAPPAVAETPKSYADIIDPREAGEKKLDDTWATFADRAVERVTPDAWKRARATYDEYERTGLAGAIQVAADDVPVADQLARAVLSEESVADIARQEAAEMLGSPSWAELKGRDKTESAAGMLYRIVKNRASKKTEETKKQLDEVVGEGPTALVKGATARLATAAPLAVTSAWKEGDTAHTMAVGLYEKTTGRQWVGKRQLERLRTSNPEAYRKARNAQSTTVEAVSRELVEIGQGLGSLLTPAVRMVAEGVSAPEQGDKWKSIFGETPFTADTMMHMAGAMLEDRMQTVDRPVDRALEAPLGMTLDALGAVTSPLGAASRLSAAKAIAATEGVGKALVKSAPVPFVKSRANVAVKAAEAEMWQATMDVVRRSTWAREFVDAAPTSLRSTVDRATEARRRKAGEQERSLDAVNELRETFDAKPVRFDSTPSAREARKAKGVAGEFRQAVEDAGENWGAKKAALEVHEEILRLKQERAAVNGGELLDQRGMVDLLDDPRIMLHLDKMPNIDKLLETGVRGRLKKIKKEQLELQELRNADLTDPAKIIKKQQRVDELRDQYKQLRGFDEAMYSNEAARKHGAWMEITDDAGKVHVLGGVDAAVAVMKRRAAGLDPWEGIRVSGNDPRMVASMEAAMGVGKLSTEYTQRMVRHGLMNNAEADLRVGMLFNKMTDPQRAADLNPGALALNPHVALQEASNINQHLALVEDLRHQVVLPEGFSEGYKLLDKKISVGGEQVNAMRKGRDFLVQVPDKVGISKGIDAPKYGSPSHGLANQWVRQDDFELLQSVLGARVGGFEKWASVFAKNKVINNPFSHKNAFISDVVNFANAGINLVESVPRAVRMLRGKGSAADRVIGEAIRHRGGLEGAAVESVDRLAGVQAGGLTDLKAQLTRLPKAMKDSELSDWFVGGYGSANHGAAMSAWRAVTDKFSGGFGMAERAWVLRDRVARMAAVDEGFRRAAVHGGFTKADLKNPATVKKILAEHPEFLDKGMELGSELMLDYGSIPRGPRLLAGGAGMNELARRSGVMQFIAYPLKASRLWTKNMVTQPIKTQVFQQAGRSEWDQLSEQQRLQRIGSSFDAGWEKYTLDGDKSINVKSLVPTAFLPPELIESTLSVAGKKGLGITMWAQTLMEAINNKTWRGQQITGDADTMANKATRGMYFVTKSMLNPTFFKLAGTGRINGVLDKSLDGVVDPLTGKEYSLSNLTKGFFGGVRTDQQQRAHARYASAHSRLRGEYAKIDGYQRDKWYEGSLSLGKITAEEADARKRDAQLVFEAEYAKVAPFMETR